ncbi:hypothetical protein BC936DRAFT_147978 [Jimgerdemannia flammicorona]|uniref:Uncharacterized protein n=1 Tax=Jimgerdemannia flammicorona TaxID=994334 RepID=A0A433DL81_9FUNG|nr:hypothetical protein BC936DRAFT_147978 [Jimgerdemannia flammicorona]
MLTPEPAPRSRSRPRRRRSTDQKGGARDMQYLVKENTGAPEKSKPKFISTLLLRDSKEMLGKQIQISACTII